MNIFLDTSAPFKLYCKEVGTKQLVQMVSGLAFRTDRDLG